MSIKFKWNRSGYLALRQSPQMRALIQAHADRIAAAANRGLPADAQPYVADVQVVPEGTVGMVKTSDAANRRHNRKTNALLKALR